MQCVGVITRRGSLSFGSEKGSISSPMWHRWLALVAGVHKGLLPVWLRYHGTKCLQMR